jgi:type IV secretion system protein VirD4
MKKQQDNGALPWVLLAVPVLWAAAIMAYAYEDGMNLFDLLGRFTVLMERPFAIGWTRHTLKFMLVGLLLYGCGAALYLSTRENRRPGEEHGSARWGSARQICAKYRDKDPMKNTILTQNVRMGLNGKKHRRNLLQIVIGGSGAGKTRFFCKPNLMQANCSFLVTDPKGEMMRAVAPLLIQRGYTIKVFDLIDPANSDAFNPFPYIRDDKDAMKLVHNLIRNTTPKNASNNDPFWEKSEIALDTALILYLLHEAPPEEQNFEMVMYMIENGGAREDSDDFQSPLDLLFEALEEEDPGHIAVREYKIFKQAAGKTAKSILLSAAVRLSAFIIPEIVGITSRDDMELGMMGDRKQAVFAIIPDNDGTFNYLVGMLYTCAFQALYYQADKVHQGALPVPVRLMMDEFCNVSLPDDFGKLQATMRSRNIMSTIVLQNISALKALFKDDWEGLMGNADTLVYLGGNEQSTHKYISEMLGKETLDTRNRSISKGSHGSSSTSYQQTGRELLTPDEVRAMDNAYAIVFIRGERPVIDKKYDILKHPNIKLTEDGGAVPYIHHPGLTFAQEDLSLPFDGLDNIIIIDEEELPNEKDQH